MPAKKTFILAILGIFTNVALAAIFWTALPKGSPSPPQSPIAQEEKAQELEFGRVLSQATISAQEAVSNPSSPTPTPAEEISKNPFLAGDVTIVLLGDSMIDSLGDLKTLELVLTQYWPNVRFKLLNYGVGSTSVESGLKRLTEGFRNHDKDFPPLFSQNPQILVLESFAYNHLPSTPEGVARYKDTLSEIIRQVKAKGIQVLLLVTIAPNQDSFAQGAPGINWSAEQRREEAQKIKTFLEAAADVAKSTGTPLVDAYHPSLDKGGSGKQIFINPGDNIHPSQAGIELVSDLITQKIKELSLIEKVLLKP